MSEGSEEVGDQGDGEEEGQDVADRLADFHAFEAQPVRENQNQGDEENAVAGGGEDVGGQAAAAGLEGHVADGDHCRHG